MLHTPSRGFEVRLAVPMFMLFTLFGSALKGHCGQADKKPAPAPLKKVIGCLFAADYVRKYDLEPLGLKESDWVWVRYHVGSVPRTSPTPGEFYVVVYSSDSQKGVLLLALPNKAGGFEALRNAYQLSRDQGHWTADEGNGGYVVYEAMGHFVTELFRQTRYRVRLESGGSECSTED